MIGLLDSTLDPVVKDWVNQVGKPGQIQALNRCVKALRQAGILQELDLFHLIGGLDSDVQRLRPLITTSATKTFTAVASPTLAYNGVTGNGSTSYLDSNWNPSTNVVKYIRDSCSLGGYIRTEINETKTDWGFESATVFTGIRSRNAGNTVTSRMNQSSSSSVASSSSLGLFLNQRVSAASTQLYRAGVQIDTYTNASMAIPSFNLYICAQNANGTAATFSTKNISLIFAGSGNINQSQFYRIIQTYMTEVGLAV